MTTKAPVTVVALMNAMIGGTILVLPLLYLQAGIISSLVATLITGLVNYYSCSVCLDHLQDNVDLPQCIHRHFGNPIYAKVYDTCVYIYIQMILLLYFELIVIQWQTIIGSQSFWIGIVNFAVLIVLIFIMRKYHLGVSLLGYGIVSIVGYLLFLIWALASAPSGTNHYPIATGKVGTLLDTLATAFSLQGVFVPILRNNLKQTQNGVLLVITYALGCFVYGFIGFAGSFGILNRPPAIKDPQTVEDFFPIGDWEVRTIAGIYLIHLYSVFPEYLLISKSRFFSLFGAEYTKEVSFKDVAYIVLVVGICLAIDLSGVPLNTILAINGTVFGFLFIYFMPISIYVKCNFFSTYPPGENKIEMPKLETSEKEEEPDGVYSLMPNKSPETLYQSKYYPYIRVSCSHNQSNAKKTTQLVLMIILAMFGLAFLGFSIYNMIEAIIHA